MPEGQWTILPDRGVVGVGGPDAAYFLQNLVTADIDAVAARGAGYGALLSPQGKVLFDFIVTTAGGEFLFDLPKAQAADFARRLGFYKLRAAVTVADSSSERVVAAILADDLPLELRGRAVADPRHPGLGFRAVVTAGDVPVTSPGWRRVDPATYAAQRIALGVPEGGTDFAFGDAFPHDADLDQLGGIDFRKGCYVGQEVVSRMEHRGTARRRIIAVRGDAPLPPPGTAVEAGGQALGTLGSANGAAGLATIRLDRAREALDAGVPITAGGVPVTLAIPDWARFSWPPKAAAE